MDMKQKRVHILNYLLFIYLFFYSFQIIKADACTEGCILEDKKCTHKSTFIESCPSYCVPDLARGGCFYCESNMNSTMYYIFEVDENYTCSLEPHCGGNKLVFNTRQCVKNCTVGPNKFYEMDGICYTEEDSKKGNRNCKDKTCNCINTYSKTFFINDNKYIRRCYNKDDKCGPEHTKYDFDSKLCGTGDCGTKLKKYETRDRSTNILRCSTKCLNGEYAYNGYCLDKCPATTYIYKDPTKGNTCVKSCSGYITGNECTINCIGYIYDDKKTCKSTCDRPFFYNIFTYSNRKNKWKVVSVDSFDRGYEAKKAIDENIYTFWHTQFRKKRPGHPHTIIVNMGETLNVSGFIYQARQDKYVDGMVKDYQLYLSPDGSTWGTYVKKSKFNKVRKAQLTSFSPRICSHFKFVATSEYSNRRRYTHAAELGVKADPLKYCTKSCGSRYIDGDYCQPTCSSGYFIRTNNDNIKICVPSSGCHVKYNDRNSPKYCYKSCTESGYPYYLGTTCYDRCPTDTPYHVEGKYQCLKNCPDNYYPSDNTCYCSGLYAYTYTTSASGDKRDKKCYANETECKNNTYSYRKGNECLKQCAPNFELVVNNNTESSFLLKRCYNNKEECKSNGYFFYNSAMLKCWSTCPYEMWSIELDNEGKPKEDITKSTCVDKCGKDYPKYTEGTKVCKKECDNGQYYMLNETDKCIGECPYDYVGEDNECLEKCDNKKYYFPMGNGKSKCVIRCKDYGKFYLKMIPFAMIVAQVKVCFIIIILTINV